MRTHGKEPHDLIPLVVGSRHGRRPLQPRAGRSMALAVGIRLGRRGEVHLLEYLKLLKGQVGKVSGSLLSRRPTCTFEGRGRLTGPTLLIALMSACC